MTWAGSSVECRSTALLRQRANAIRFGVLYANLVTSSMTSASAQMNTAEINGIVTDPVGES